MMKHSHEQPGTYPPIAHRDLELLSAFLDDELTSRERATLEARMQNEPALRHHLEELEATVLVLKQLPPVHPPRSFALRPEFLAHPQVIRPQPRIPWMTGRIWAGGMLASLLLLISLTTLLITLTRSEQPADFPQVASHPESLDRTLLVLTDIPLSQTRPQEPARAFAPIPSPPPAEATGHGASRGSPREELGEPMIAKQPAERLAEPQPTGDAEEYSEGYSEETVPPIPQAIVADEASPEAARGMPHQPEQENNATRNIRDAGETSRASDTNQAGEPGATEEGYAPTPAPDANNSLRFWLTLFVILIVMATTVGSIFWFVRHRR